MLTNLAVCPGLLAKTGSTGSLSPGTVVAGLFRITSYNVCYTKLLRVTTIREDVHDRWKPGMKIHMVVFNRSKNQFQFVPTLVCKSVQDIYMTNIHGYEISIDDTYQYSIDQIARNDGFKDSEDMRT